MSVEEKRRRIPRLGDRVIFQGDRKWHEALIVAIATDKCNELGRVKVQLRSRFGFEHEEWIWPFDLCYLTPEQACEGEGTRASLAKSNAL